MRITKDEKMKGMKWKKNEIPGVLILKKKEDLFSRLSMFVEIDETTHFRGIAFFNKQ